MEFIENYYHIPLAIGVAWYFYSQYCKLIDHMGDYTDEIKQRLSTLNHDVVQIRNDTHGLDDKLNKVLAEIESLKK